jgi:hypothetical protein
LRVTQVLEEHLYGFLDACHGYRHASLGIFN